MVHPCDKPCGNKTASGYCATTACINPQYSNIGTAHYGQGVQKRVITNADRFRAMTDEELAELWWERVDCGECPVHRDCKMTGQDCKKLALDWLREEVSDEGKT